MKGDGPTTVEPIASGDGWATWMSYPEEAMARASHVLVDGDDCWLVDPLDADDLDEWVREFGDVAGVVVLLDRHTRDAAAIARRHDVAVHVPEALAGLADDLDAPVEPFAGELADTGFRARTVVDRPWWKEAALYRGEDDTLVVPEAVGTASIFRTSDERLGVHPGLRLRPPRTALGDYGPERILVGHGEPVVADAAGALTTALAGARRQTPRLYARNLGRLLPV